VVPDWFFLPDPSITRQVRACTALHCRQAGGQAGGQAGRQAAVCKYCNNTMGLK